MNELRALRTTIRCAAAVSLAAVFVVFAMTHSGAAQLAPGEPVTIPAADIPGYGHSGATAGTFGQPSGATGKIPVVLILHSSAGIDGTGAFYATALQAAGIGTLEIAMFARGGRPSAGHQATIPDEAAALRWLGTQPIVDPQRLGVMGFSWGATDAVLLASDQVEARMGSNVPKPAAFAPLYPACTNLAKMVSNPHSPLYNVETSMRAVPMLIQEGTRDDYEVGDRPCESFTALWPQAARDQAVIRYYEGATHQFDSPTAPHSFSDPFAHGGAGGMIFVMPDPGIAAQARAAVVKFFVENLHP